jgi:hypothetical protein
MKWGKETATSLGGSRSIHTLRGEQFTELREEKYFKGWEFC